MEHKAPKVEPMSVESLVARKKCCGNKCKNCPYHPRWEKGSKELETQTLVVKT